MPLKKIAEPFEKYRGPCRSMLHNPPNMISLSPGTYEWTCPACGEKRVFTVHGFTMGHWTHKGRGNAARWLS